MLNIPKEISVPKRSTRESRPNRRKYEKPALLIPRVLRIVKWRSSRLQLRYCQFSIVGSSRTERAYSIHAVAPRIILVLQQLLTIDA